MPRKYIVRPWWLLSILAVLIGLFSSAVIVHGAATKTPKKAYAVSAVLPPNQVDGALNYWQLSLTPNQTQTLQLQVANIGSEPITVDVYANNGTTDSNPQIIYSQAATSVYPKTATSFASLVVGARKKSVTLAPAAVKVVEFTIRAPAKQFSGMILGGLYSEADVTTTATPIRQKVAYQRSVVLQGSNINTERPKLKFGAVQPVAEAGKLALRLVTSNDAPMYAYALTTDLTVTNRGTKKRVIHTTAQNGKVAPQSRFNWQFPIHNLPAGAYRMTLVVAGNNVARQTITRNFTIEQSQVQALADYSSPNRRNMIIVIILVILIIILMIAGWVLIYNKGRRHGERLWDKLKH